MSEFKPAGPEKITYQGKIIEVIQQDMQVAPDKVVTFEVARRSPGVRLVVVNALGTDILLTKEYRRELGDYDYRLPGGKVFDSLDEYNDFLASGKNILAAAQTRVQHEAAEETGLVVNQAEHIHTSKLGATMEWDLLYFLVSDYEEHANGQNLEAGEDIAVTWVPLDEARTMALDGHMSEERSALVLLKFLKQMDSYEQGHHIAR